MASLGKKKKSSRTPSSQTRSNSPQQKTEVLINVYDLLPPGTLSSMLWYLGSSLLHTAVVIKDREYAYGLNDRKGETGVYWTKPRCEPPGGTFRCELLQGFTFRSPAEIDSIIKEVSEKFLGTSYNLLSNNCNHFTSYLCQRLTSKNAPSWLNRAATVGIVLPCVVPREWIAPPDHDTADGELLKEDEEDERAAMLPFDKRRTHGFHESVLDFGIYDDDRDQRNGSTGKGKGLVRDNDGRGLPASELTPQTRIR